MSSCLLRFAIIIHNKRVYLNNLINIYIICMKRITSINVQNIFNVLSGTIIEYYIKWEHFVSVYFDGASTVFVITISVPILYVVMTNA